MGPAKLFLKDCVFISTLSDLGKYMLKLDVCEGTYKLKSFLGGYVITKDNSSPNLKHVVKIFNNRDWDRGLSGTYHDGETQDSNHMRLFNEWLRFYVHQDFKQEYYFGNESDESMYYDSDVSTDGGIDEDGSDETIDEHIDESMDGDSFDDRIVHSDASSSGSSDRGIDEKCLGLKKLKSLPSYHNLPVIFYLNRDILENELINISLSNTDDCPSELIGNVQKVWTVRHDVYGDIGLAVQQEKLFCMMGDQAGIAFFATSDSQAFGNFNYYDNADDSEFSSEWVCHPNYEFKCKFNPCNCNTTHKVAKK